MPAALRYAAATDFSCSWAMTLLKPASAARLPPVFGAGAVTPVPIVTTTSVPSLTIFIGVGVLPARSIAVWTSLVSAAASSPASQKMAMRGIGLRGSVKSMPPQ